MEYQYGDYKTTLLVGRQKEFEPSSSFYTELTILTNFVNTCLIDFRDKLSVEAFSSNYTTLKYEDRDLLRLKFSDNTKWITIFIPPKYKKFYMDDLLFAEEKNKNKLQWKSTLNNAYDLNNFKDICLMDINFFESTKKD